MKFILFYVKLNNTYVQFYKSYVEFNLCEIDYIYVQRNKLCVKFNFFYVKLSCTCVQLNFTYILILNLTQSLCLTSFLFKIALHMNLNQSMRYEIQLHIYIIKLHVSLFQFQICKFQTHSKHIPYI